MSCTTDRYMLNNVNSLNISLTNCGITENHPLHTSNELIYPDYSLHFIVEGKGTYIFQGKTYHLKKGEGFLIVPGIPNEYIGDKDEPWKYVYIGFTGDGAADLLRDIGLGFDTITFTYPEYILPDLYAMHSSGKNRTSKGYGILGCFFTVISHLVFEPGTTNMWSPELYVKKAKRFIKDNYAYDISVKTISSHLGLDRTYLYRLFNKYVGTTPSKYILDVRLKKASEKLKDFDISINEIATSSGFNDISHFYKAFRTKYNMTPKKYREELLGGKSNERKTNFKNRKTSY